MRMCSLRVFWQNVRVLTLFVILELWTYSTAVSVQNQTRRSLSSMWLSYTQKWVKYRNWSGCDVFMRWLQRYFIFHHIKILSLLTRSSWSAGWKMLYYVFLLLVVALWVTLNGSQFRVADESWHTNPAHSLLLPLPAILLLLADLTWTITGGKNVRHPLEVCYEDLRVFRPEHVFPLSVILVLEFGLTSPVLLRAPREITITKVGLHTALCNGDSRGRNSRLSFLFLSFYPRRLFWTWGFHPQSTPLASAVEERQKQGAGQKPHTCLTVNRAARVVWCYLIKGFCSGVRGFFF